MARRQWKKILSVLLCVVIVLSCNTQVLAVGIDVTDNGTYLDEKQSEIKSDAQVEAVEKLIEDIGTVEYTYTSLSKIVAAEKAYDKMENEQKLLIQNYGALKASRNAYEALAADNVDTSELTVNDSGVINTLKWTVYTNGLLEISGEGAVPSYSSGEAPWYTYAASITSILVRSTVTGIGSRAFYGCNKVTDITLPFVGESRTATGPSSAFGYIFGYSTGSFGCFSGSGYAIGDIYTVSGSYNCYITSITGSQIDYVRYSYTVPSSIKTVNITDATRIPGGAFANCSYITKIVLNDGITSIGEYAFYDSGIKDFAIPESVSSIGQYSFYSCNGLTEMFVPNTVTEIPKYSFYGCSNISRLVLSSNTKSIGDYAFYGCSGFTNLIIPDKTESIGSYAFGNCSKIEAINIPDSVITLGSYAFGGCSSAKSLYIGSNLKTIPTYAFQNCAGFTFVNVPKTVTRIEAFAFVGCNNVTEITLPFVGESKAATGPSSAVGYIFGYSTGYSGYFSGRGYAVDDIYRINGSYSCYITSISGSQINYNGYSYNVPSSIKTVNITDATRVPDGAFANCSYITKIVLNDGITSIGEYAFYDSSIKDFAIPESVSSIGQYSFYSCTGLIEMFVPNTVTEIPKYSFYGCSNISRLVLSRHTKSIGDYAFYGCSGFTSLVIPDETESIGSYTFNNCSKIDAINIPDSVITLGSYAFGGCSSAKSLYIGSNLKTIPTYAFQNCAGFTFVNVPKTVTRIEAFAFAGCNSVTEITLPFVGESRTATGPSSAFGYIFGYSTGYSGYFSGSGYAVDDIYRINGSYSCYITSISGSQINYNGYSYNVPSSIKTVNITDATRIPDGAFANCSYITKIVLNDGITSIGEYAFYNNPWYNELSDEFVIDGDNVLIKYNGTESEVIIPNNIKHIADSIFKNNTIISSVTLPDGLLSIGKKAFSGCTNLTALTIPKSVIEIGSNAIPSTCVINAYQPSAGYNYRSTNRVVLNNSFTTGNETYYYVINDDGCAEIIGCTTTSTELTVPTEIDGIIVNKIGDYGFSGCTTLNSITIPSNILNIGKYAFNGCTGLVNATIPTTVRTVGDYAFNNCTGLVNVTISEGVQFLGEGAFYNCTSLIEAVVPDTAAYIGSYAFYNCSSIVTATIGTMAEFIGDYTFYNCSSLENVVIGYSVKTIGDYAFYGCALGRVSIPTVTTSIGRYAFAENAQMTRATLRKNLLTIGDGAFKNCGLLATINIPTTVTYIGLEAFENCSSIASITIPVGVTEINNRTFSNCSSLANVTINGNVTRIGASAFYNNAFESITLPETLNVIDDSAFRHCIKLNEINIPTTVSKIGDAVFIDCSALNNASIPDSVADVGYGVFFYNNDLTVYIRKNNGVVSDNMLELQGMSHVVLDPEISAIGNNTFAYCYALENITYGGEKVSYGEYKFSTALKTVGIEAFKDNPKLRNFIVPDTIESFGENVFYNVIQSGYHCKDVTVTFYYVNGVIAPNILASQHICHVAINDYIHTLSEGAFYNCPVIETFSIPDTVSSVGSNVFANPGKNVTAIFRGVDGIIDASVYDGKISGINYIAIDKNVNAIGDYAFANTDTVTGVVITNTDNIGNYAFYKGTALDYVEISVCKTIGDYAFAENSLLKRVEIDSVKRINDYAFFKDIAINNLYIDADLYHIGEHAFESCKSIPEVVLPETVREIGAYAFYDCNSMESINIPKDVTEINEYTFFGCASLSDIIIPDTVLSIGDYAYYGCVLAKNIKLSNQLKSIGSYAFYNCNQAQEIKLPNTLNSIGNYAFRSCSSIKEIKVPNSVTTLGDCVFYACTGLEQATFGVGIGNIGNSVFYGCVRLNEVILNGNVEYIHDLAFYGAEDAIVYSFENQYVEEYCYDMGLVYYEMTKNLIQETISSQIDYDNLIVFTNIKNCVDVSELIGISDGVDIVSTASYINGNFEYYGTGSIVSVSCNDSYAGEYTIIVNGDLNGDSVCNVLDVFEAERASNGHIEAPIEQVYAANGMVSDELDASSYQNVVNMALAS